MHIIAHKAVVLAAGMSGTARRFDIRGVQLPFVSRKIPYDWEGKNKTVLVVGAGLSANACILLAINKGWKGRKFGTFDPNYPECCDLLELMEGHVISDQYVAFSESHLIDIDQSGICTVYSDVTTETSLVHVDKVIILIGTTPDLEFMKTPYFKKNPISSNCDIETRSQGMSPVYIEVNPYTMESIQEPGLYAIGPLRGDNFVRFIVGDAIGIYSHLYGRPGLT